MKAVTLTIPVLMLSFLLGCTEQSQVTGPATTASNTIESKINNNIFDSVKFEEMVAGPGGTKYLVFGSVEYALSIDGKAYSLSTHLNATINQSGNENSWVVSSEKSFTSVLGEKGVGIVSESNDFASIKDFALYRLTLEYTIENGLMTVTNVKVVNAKVVDGTIASESKINNNIFDSVKFEEMVAGPGGTKYLVFGSVEYALSIDGKAYSLSTHLNATINQSGNENSWVVSSEKSFKSVLGEKEVGIVSESNDFALIKDFALYRLALEYTIENGLMTVTNVKVVNAKIIDDIKIVD